MGFWQSALLTLATRRPSCTILALVHGNRSTITRSDNHCPQTVHTVARFWSTTIRSISPRRRHIWWLVDGTKATCLKSLDSRMALGMTRDNLTQRAEWDLGIFFTTNDPTFQVTSCQMDRQRTSHRRWMGLGSEWVVFLKQPHWQARMYWHHVNNVWLQMGRFTNRPERLLPLKQSWLQ